MKRNLLFKAVFQVLLAILLLCSILALFSCQNDVPENKKDNGKLEYKVNSDGETCTITGLGTYSSKYLIIPENIDGYTVTAIANCAFQGTDIVSFEGADTITTIGKYAFQNCKQLQTVVIPNTVTEIGEHCFEYCENLHSINLPSNLKNIKAFTFAECKSIEIMFLPEGIVEIGDAAFYACEYMTSVNIPNTVETIGKGAFLGCYYLKNIIIPNSVTTIGDVAFSACLSLTNICFPASVVNIGEAVISSNSLTSIDVDVNNPILSSIDGHLYSDNNTVFISYACAKIDTSFVIPDGVKKILKMSFTTCINLQIISIPKSVYYIGSQIFFTSPNIETIYYDGTVDDWKKILKAPDWNEETQSTFIIICTDGTIAMDGTVIYN